MKKIFACIAFITLLFACVGSKQNIYIIPLPAEINYTGGTFDIGKNLKLEFDDSNKEVAQIVSFLTQNPDIKTSKKGENSLAIHLTSDTATANEAYKINIEKNKINLSANTYNGLFYGIQTLIQLASGKKEIPCMEINDYPRFPYRGVHLDVSRHFFPKEFILKYIDVLAMYKINRFHWHLTDGAGWRIEIKKYPKLTEIAAWRNTEKWKDWWANDKKYAQPSDTLRYGGFYTQDDVREIVAYAQSKYITIIPEIEMPGHSEEVVAVYPELSCSGIPYTDRDFCAGSEKTFEFLEDVLSEVMELFPSEYIHIGGDECGKAAWKTCPKCQQRMIDENIENLNGLQSYFIRRIEKFLISKGRNIIGWDEIIEGGLAPEATVMSWRGVKGGIAAAKAGHDVVMTPNTYLYFDYYQGNPATQPEAFGGLVSLRKTYSYEPIPTSLTAEESKHILGAQANMWTEYMPTTQQVEYMLLPRMLALAEVVWTPKENKKWSDFRRRVNAHFKMLDSLGYNYCGALNEINIIETLDYKNKKVQIEFDTEEFEPTIYYTTDGTIPTTKSKLYTQAFYLSDSAIVNAAVFVGDNIVSDVFTKEINYHKAIGANINYVQKYDTARYSAGGDNALIDGYRGGWMYNDNRWQGFLCDLDVTIDLGEEKDISTIELSFMQNKRPGIYMPAFVEFYISKNAETFNKIGEQQNDISQDETRLTLKKFTIDMPKTTTRYIRVYAKLQRGYMFTDEIIIW